MGSIPGLGRSPGRGQDNPFQYSCLENSVDRGAWQATVHGVAKSQTRLQRLGTHTYTITGERRGRSRQGRGSTLRRGEGRVLVRPRAAVWTAPRCPCNPRASVLCDTLVKCSACVFMKGIGIQLYFPELFSFISSSLETTISWIRCIALVCISVISTLVLITSFYFFGFFNGF